MGFAAQAIQGAYDKRAANKNREYAAQQQRAGMQLINSLDYEPMYASQNVPTYQRSQSPVARSYIESMLMGANPDSISSTRAGAGMLKARAQAGQNAMYGTPQERLAQQQAYMQTTPWAVKTPTRAVKSIVTPEANWTAQNSDYAAYGVNKPLNDALTETGTNLEGLKGQASKHKASMDDIMRDITTEQRLAEVLNNQYGGNADKLAADIRAAGGFNKLMAQRGGR